MKIEFDVWGVTNPIAKMLINVDMAETDMEGIVKIFNVVLLGAGFTGTVKEETNEPV